MCGKPQGINHRALRADVTIVPVSNATKLEFAITASQEIEVKHSSGLKLTVTNNEPKVGKKNILLESIRHAAYWAYISFR